MNVAIKPLITIEDYLAGELESSIRHEYIAGEVYAMSGESDTHNSIALNLALALRQHLGTGPCKVYVSDVKLHLSIKREEFFYYPDVMVACDPADSDRYFKTRPTFLAEIQSPSTERVDRHEKLASYITIPTLQEYLLVSQHEPVATLFRRVNQWRQEPLTTAHTLVLPALNGFTLPVSALFAGVTLTPRESRE